MFVNPIGAACFANNLKTKQKNNSSNYYVSFGSAENISPLNLCEKNQIICEISKSKDVKQGSLGKVYKVISPQRPILAVKEYAQEYEGRNPQLEAKNLKKLPPDCKRVQRFVDLFENRGKKYLVTTFQEGESLSKLKDSMSDTLIGNILDELFKIERSGLAFYDYSMANIVFSGDEPKFFDFEISKEQSFNKINESAKSDLCHLSRNTYFPFTTNMAGFEIRTVGKIIGELERYPNSEERSNNFVERYLKRASVFFIRMADLYSQKCAMSEIPKEAVNYSKILGMLFKNPSKEIVSIEKQSMRIKELLTEYWFRNDPNLPHDDILYNNLPSYIENLKKRFGNLQNSIIKLFLETQNPEIKKYCSTTAELLNKISEKEITYLMTKCIK